LNRHARAERGHRAEPVIAQSRLSRRAGYRAKTVELIQSCLGGTREVPSTDVRRRRRSALVSRSFAPRNR
jgi:hypothetical protein